MTKPENLKSEQATIPLISGLHFMLNAEAVRGEASEGFWFKPSWLILQAKNMSCCLDNAEQRRALPVGSCCARVTGVNIGLRKSEVLICPMNVIINQNSIQWVYASKLSGNSPTQEGLLVPIGAWDTIQRCDKSFCTKISVPHLGVASCLLHCTCACSLSMYGKDLSLLSFS